MSKPRRRGEESRCEKSTDKNRTDDELRAIMRRASEQASQGRDYIVELMREAEAAFSAGSADGERIGIRVALVASAAALQDVPGVEISMLKILRHADRILADIDRGIDGHPVLTKSKSVNGKGGGYRFDVRLLMRRCVVVAGVLQRLEECSHSVACAKVSNYIFDEGIAQRFDLRPTKSTSNRRSGSLVHGWSKRILSDDVEWIHVVPDIEMLFSELLRLSQEGWTAKQLKERAMKSLHIDW